MLSIPQYIRTSLLLTFFLNGFALAQTEKTQWRYGEDICAGGWRVTPFKACEDRLAPPLWQGRVTSRDFCGVTVTPERNKSCAKIEFGPRVVIPNTTIVKTDTLGENGNGNAEKFLQRCINLGKTYTSGADTDLEATILVSAKIGDISNDRSLYLTTCTMELARARLQERTDPSCGVIPGFETVNSCDKTVYRLTARKECGYQTQLTLGPFSPSSFNTDQKECLTGDDLPDQTTEQLVAKTKYLLQPVYGLYSSQFTIVQERRQAMLMHFLRTRSAELPADLINAIWKLNSRFRLGAASNDQLSADDISIFLGEKHSFDTNGSTPQKFISQMVYVSVPKYAESASVCLGRINECEQDKKWTTIYLPLARFDGNKYHYIAEINNLPEVFTVRTFVSGKYLQKEFSRDVAYQNNEFDLVGINKDEWKVWFPSTEGWKSVDLYSDDSSVRTYDGALASDDQLLVYRDAEFFNPFNNKTFKLEGVNGSLRTESIRWSKNFIVADVGDRKIKVWSATDGKLVNTISYPSTNSSGNADRLYMNNNDVIIILSGWDHKIWTYGTDGKQIGTFPEMSGHFEPGQFMFSSDGKRLYYGGDSLVVYDANVDVPRKVMTWGDGQLKFILGLDESQKTIFVQSFNYIQKDNQATGEYVHEYVQAWDIASGLFLTGAPIPDNSPFGVLVHQEHKIPVSEGTSNQ